MSPTMKKILNGLLAMAMLVIGYVYLAKIFAPGSYANAEIYELSVSEPVLDSIVQDFKDENPQYKIPGELELKDGRANPNDHWYHLYFYYKKENQIVYAWARAAMGTKTKTNIAFVGINEGLKLGNWKDINKDFGFFENRAQKKKFEERILNVLKEKIESTHQD